LNFIAKLKEKRIPLLLGKILLFFVIIFLLDASIGKVLEYLYFKQDSGLLYRTTYSLDSTKAEIVIFGSSTANHHYYPNSFEKRMDLSLYNAGRDGSSIFYHYAVLKCILKRYSPKIAILDFNIGEFKKDEQSYDRISSLLPYYQNHPEIRAIIQQKSQYEKYKIFSKIYPFNSLLFTIAIGNSDLNKLRENIQSEVGYLPLKRVWTRDITTDTSNKNYVIDSNKIDIFENFIRDCHNSDVKLYIVASPRFLKYKFEDCSISIARDIAKKFNVDFFNFSDDPDFLDHPELFADISHLNDTGAKIYSNKVIDKILNDAP
jgi:hypothetical protein